MRHARARAPGGAIPRHAGGCRATGSTGYRLAKAAFYASGLDLELYSENVVVAIFGAGTMVFGLTDSYPIAFVALVVISAADMISMYIRGSIVPLVTPNDQLGRVSAVEGVFIGASNELGAFESGVAARAFGLPLAIAGGGFITMAIAGTFAIVFPSLRNIDTFDELQTVAEAPRPSVATTTVARHDP